MSRGCQDSLWEYAPFTVPSFLGVAGSLLPALHPLRHTSYVRSRPLGRQGVCSPAALASSLVGGDPFRGSAITPTTTPLFLYFIFYFYFTFLLLLFYSLRDPLFTLLFPYDRGWGRPKWVSERILFNKDFETSLHLILRFFYFSLKQSLFLTRGPPHSSGLPFSCLFTVK